MWKKSSNVRHRSLLLTLSMHHSLSLVLHQVCNRIVLRRSVENYFVQYTFLVMKWIYYIGHIGRWIWERLILSSMRFIVIASHCLNDGHICQSLRTIEIQSFDLIVRWWISNGCHERTTSTTTCYCITISCVWNTKEIAVHFVLATETKRRRRTYYCAWTNECLAVKLRRL